MERELAEMRGSLGREVIRYFDTVAAMAPPEVMPQDVFLTQAIHQGKFQWVAGYHVVERTGRNQVPDAKRTIAGCGETREEAHANAMATIGEAIKGMEHMRGYVDRLAAADFTGASITIHATDEFRARND